LRRSVDDNAWDEESDEVWNPERDESSRSLVVIILVVIIVDNDRDNDPFDNDLNPETFSSPFTCGAAGRRRPTRFAHSLFHQREAIR
jgi:hypothetical protein